MARLLTVDKIVNTTTRTIVTNIVHTLFANNEMMVAKILSINITKNVEMKIETINEKTKYAVESGKEKITSPTRHAASAKTMSKTINNKNFATITLPRAIGLEINNNSVPLSR
jgi:hypothetical protein